MKGEEARKLKDEEIKAELGRLRTKLFDLRSQTVTEKVENTAQFAELRKDVARLMTERNARRLAKDAPTKTAAAKAPAKAASGKAAAGQAAAGKKPAKGKLVKSK